MKLPNLVSLLFCKVEFLSCGLCWVPVAVLRLSVIVASAGSSSVRCLGFSLRWLLLHEAWSLGLRAQALWSPGSGAPQRGGSFWGRDRTHVPCFGRQSLNH